ncbi:MAG: HlyD family efflux transporter periplasmic adaptor subunit [Syntrophobacteraceae bacterium]|nr:HlyD family efflux transporter periplasmic adaptor subunit [Syntrophobacteraceae bacterium]
MFSGIAPPWGRQHRASSMIMIAGFLTLVFIIWASVARINEVTHAKGVVIAKSRTQVIQSAIDGVIMDIPVEEGQSVKSGQVLARLERTQAEVAQNDSYAKVAALEALLVRLHAEVLGSPLVFPESLKGYPHFVTNQTELYLRRKNALDSEIRTFRESLRLVREELDLTSPLVETGDVGKIEVIRLQRQVAELNGQINLRRNRFFQEAQQEMTKAEEELSTQKQTLAERSFIVEKLEIRSPVDAMVNKIQLTTHGAKVRPGEVVMELLPTNSQLVIEGKLRPADIGFVRTGMPATVKLDAFDYAIFGVLKGKVTYISPDAITEKLPQGDAIYYRVQIRLDELHDLRRKGKSLKVQPGMTVGIDILTGRRTVLSYLTKPISKVFNDSMGER